MSARAFFFFSLTVASFALGHAAPAAPPDGTEKKSPSALPAADAAKNSEASSAKATVQTPASATPVASPETLSPKSDAVPATADGAAPPASLPAADAPKPGILTAVKAKGPPPVNKAPPPPVPLSPRFQQVRQKMSALFDARNAPPTPSDPRANPFRPAGAAPVAPIPAVDGAAPAPVAVNSDLASLQQAVATLRVKGTVQLGKTVQLVITSAPGKEGTYKEGDVINVNLSPDPVHVRVRVITRNSVTLTLNDAEMTLKF